jgi:hypothetical protein
MPSADAANESTATGQHAQTVSMPTLGAPVDSLAVQVSSALANLDARALDEHAEVYERVHADLNAALAEIETA